ncbi:MAG: autotransporter outer membrane beta-barrel domain-containing protein [Gammaproteobacteria bacterium]|nr:autotransporter outer membrane beta-barrel domain-containing protein [Gammaproteobacteria bacterium]
MTMNVTESRWHGLFASLLCLPLLAVLVGAVPAQAQEEDVEVLVFGSGPYTEGESALFSVLASGRPAHDVTVELTISQEGDFLAGGEAGKRRITIPGGREQKNFYVATRDDSSNEADGVITATINPGQGYFASSDHGSAVARIQDNDIPVLGIAAGADITEGGTATFNLTADPRPASPLQVSLTVQQDGQFSPEEQLGKRTVTIGTNGRGALNVDTSADNVDEDDGFITATIDPGADYQVGSSAAATVNVTDGGAPTPRISLSAPRAINEGDTATFTLSASPAPVAPVDVTVRLTERGSFAAAGEIVQRTVAVGTGGTGTFTVATENDRSTEADGSITATLVDGSGYLIHSPSQVSVTVRDATPRVSIAAGPAITEGGTASFTLTATPRISGSLDVTVNVSESGNFVDGGETGTRTVTIGTDGTGTLLVTTSDDATLEADGTISAVIAAGDGYGVGAPAQASVRVADATPRVSIAAGGAIIEGDSADFTLTADPKPSGTIYVDVAISEDGNFLASGESASRSVSIDASGRGTLTVATDNDAADERQGTITVRVEDGQAPASYGVGAPRSASVRVNDDDAGEGNLARLSVGDVTVQENANGDGTRTLMEFPVSLDRPTRTNVTATFEFRATAPTATTAPATEGKDYRVRRAEHLSVGGFHDRTEAIVRVEVLDDDEFEEKPETFELVLVDIVGAEIADGRAIGTILPDPFDAPRGTPVVTIHGGNPVHEGSQASFTLRVEPAPREDLVVTLSVYDDATSDFLAATSEGTRTVTIPGMNNRSFAYFNGVGRHTLSIDTVDDNDSDANGSIRVAIDSDPDPGAGGTYDVGARDYEASVDIRDSELVVPVVSIAGGYVVTEGASLSFMLKVEPVSTTELLVNVTVAQPNNDYVNADPNRGTGSRAITIPANASSAVVTVDTVDDNLVETVSGRVTVTVEEGSGYLVALPPDNTASATIVDNDSDLTVSVQDTTAREGGTAVFRVTLSGPSTGDVSVDWAVNEERSTATPRTDYSRRTASGRLRIPAGRTGSFFSIRLLNDAHDDPGETIVVELLNPVGVVIADGEAVATIRNDDPLPSAWLARFGRTVAERSLDSITGRMDALRTPGLDGALAGQPLSQAINSGSDLATAGLMGMAQTARVDVTPGPDSMDSPFGAVGFADGEHATSSRTLSAREAMLGSHFNLTREQDDSGGTLAFWGQTAYGRFEGAEHDNGIPVRLNGDITTGVLGADYARGRWLTGLALTWSEAEGDYTTLNHTGDRGDTDACFTVDAAFALPWCDGMTGDGSVDASLITAMPYVSWQATGRVSLWGAAGYGMGKVSLDVAQDTSYQTDTTWSMAAAGLRGDLLNAPAGGGLTLAVAADTLWAHTASEQTLDLAASDSDVARIRLGLTSSYRLALPGGGELTPRVEFGVRYDGGHAETGAGVELGGGLLWHAPRLGLRLDLAGRTLLAHRDNGMKDLGVSAALTLDPDPLSLWGASFSLRQTLGSQATGGLDALFAGAPLSTRSGSHANNQWHAEAAYGFPAFGGRFAGSPHAGLARRNDAQDWHLGWRLTPAGPAAPDVSFALRATRRESEQAAPDHQAGMELRVGW